MRMGIVTGSVVCSPLESSLRGERLLLLQPVDTDRTPRGTQIVACDTVQAGPGDVVLWEGGREAAMALRHSFNLADAAIIAIVDAIDAGSPTPDAGPDADSTKRGVT
jgi:ethanolamine utilization protein EutN